MNDEEYRKYNREKMRRWRATGDNRERASRQQWERNKASPNNAFRLMIFNARKRAEVKISADDLMEIWRHQSGLCAITGIKMTWGMGRILPTSLSIDRIDPSLGYIAGNVRLVCHSVNCFRQDMSDDEMFNMALAIVTNIKRPKLRLVG